ncbi:MAG TPA: DUF3822 family protein, partial [Anditalea sp.]|nr:DUF3822 family protein [Anditalea sp.]
TIMAKDQNDAVVGSQIFQYSSTEDLNYIIENCDFFKCEITQGKLFIHNDHFSLVPGLVYDPQNKAQYLNFATDLLAEKECIVFSDSLGSNNLYVIGAIEKEVFHLFESKIQALKISHGSIIGLSYLLDNKYEFIGQEVFIIMDHGHVYLSAFSSHELQIYNRFEVNSEEELLKYLFIIFKQLQFNREYCKVNVLGDLTAINSNRDSLEKYFKHIIEVNPTTNINYLPGAENIKTTKSLDAFWTI